MTVNPTAPAPQKTEKGTKYVILKRDHAELAWIEDGTARATSANAAVKIAIEESSEPSTTYVAIPECSWKPVKVTVETTKTVRLG